MYVALIIIIIIIFKAHINVKFCHSIKSIKYVVKYINKGSDYATFWMQDAGDIT